MHLPAQLSLLNCHVLSKRARTCIKAYLVLFLSLKCYGWGFCLCLLLHFSLLLIIQITLILWRVRIQWTAIYVIGHYVFPVSWGCILSVLSFALCSSQWEPQVLAVLLGVYFEPLCKLQCCSCWGSICILSVILTENLCDCVQQHFSFHLSVAANSVVFYTKCSVKLSQMYVLYTVHGLTKCGEESWEDSGEK